MSFTQTHSTKPNARIPPILLARQSTSPTPSAKTASYLVTISKQKLSDEASLPEPDLRRCLGHHALLTKTTLEAKEDMKRYLEVVEYETDSEDDEEEYDEEAVVDEVEMFNIDNVKIVDGDSEVEDMLFHEEPMVQQEEDVHVPHVVTHPRPPPGIPVLMAVSMPMPMATSFTMASTETYRPMTRIPRPTSISTSSQRSKTAPSRDKDPYVVRVQEEIVDIDADALTHGPDIDVPGSSCSSSTPSFENLPSFTSISKATPSPSSTSTSTPVKDKILNTVRGLVRRRNSSPSSSSSSSIPRPSLTPLSSPHKQKHNGTSGASSSLIRITTKNASCSSIPVRIHIHEHIVSDPSQNDGHGHSSTFERSNKTRSPSPSPSPTFTQQPAKTFTARGRECAARLGERVRVGVPMTTLRN
ncbi:uncharacterized protein BDV17DRAFT_263105 [Aspergillus undulatus]|uniref:uncharacterized protein n=1 Tax=Aspergillus undulatus TaxID=1810928 RepID=UPI003CCD298A